MRLERFNKRSALESGWHLEELAAIGIYPENYGDRRAFEAAQSILGVKADGFFGPASVAAFRRYGEPQGRVVQRIQPRWGRSRGDAAVTVAMLHHSVTRSTDATIRVLSARNYSTHYIIDPLGTIYQTAPEELMCAHAGAWNRRTIGIDIVNPYEPKLWRKNEAWAAPVPTGGRWGARYGSMLRRSVIPDTPAALEALRWLLADICERHGLGEPRWPAPGERLELDGRATAQEWSVICHGTVQANRWDGWGALMGLGLRAATADAA